MNRGGRPTPGKRLEILERRRQMVDDYKVGLSQTDLGKKYNLSQPMVCKELAVIRRQWVAEMLTDFAEKQAVELAKIERTEREAWAAWEKSKKDAETLHVRNEDADGVKKTVGEKTTKGQCGDPRFLEVICKCREQKAKIYGLYSDVNVNISNNTQVNIWESVEAEPDNVVMVEEVPLDDAG